MVFEKVLVPVDGSELSDRVLEQLRPVLLREDVELLLLRVVSPVAGESERASQERFDAATAHVERLRAGLEARGVSARARVVRGDPAAVILEQVAAEAPSLVAMSTHGRSGPARWVRGSVAERVLRACPAPLLLANTAAIDRGAAGPWTRVLVPLDGSSEAEAVLPLAVELARLHGGEVELFRVGWFAPAAMDYAVPAPIYPASLDELLAGLEPARARAALAGVRVSKRAVHGLPAEAILAEAERVPGTLVAMTTHGRSGVDRWVLGSVAENVLRACTTPVLLSRVAAS